ncbi:MAG: metallophosphoesterase [Candidatus Limnocylindria bacterium]
MLIAAGDIAACDLDGDSQTAALVAEIDGTVATLGDHAYPAGSDETFAACYDAAWGDLLDRTRPAVGNHDLQDDGGAAFYRYFGDRAGIGGEGWYSYDMGDWHVVVLNSNCELIDCDPGSPQYEWLVADLAASDATCTLAYMHHPRFSSGPHGDYPPVAPLWDALDEADADLLLVGHDHLYERFAPQTPVGVADPDGIRQFTVGTGGYDLYRAERVAPNSELIIDDTFGVLELTLHADSYDWRFLTVDSGEADAGSAACY